MKRVGPLILMLVFAGVLASTAHAAGTTTTTTHKRHTAPAQQPKLTLDAAQAIAIAKVPGGQVKSHELENEKGHLIYSFDFVVPGKPGVDEVNVDAMTGAVLAVAHENAKAEKAEKAKERREAQAPTHH